MRVNVAPTRGPEAQAEPSKQKRLEEPVLCLLPGLKDRKMSLGDKPGTSPRSDTVMRHLLK